jgi:N-acyl-D-aspartate/D-glutamate deacylase
VLRLIETGDAGSRDEVGRSMAELAAQTGRHPADVMFDLALRDGLRPVFHWSNETPAWRELLREVQRHPQMVVGVSDGGAHLDFDDGAEWSTHFLTTWWRQEGLWRLEEAVRRITALPAAVCGLTDRGLLQAGRAADVFLFDPARLDLGIRRVEPDVVTGVDRFRSVPVGIVATIVNGEVVVEDGERTGATPGQIVRPA